MEDSCLSFARRDECWKPGQNPFAETEAKNILCKLHFKCHRCESLTPNCAFVEYNKKGNWVCYNCLSPEEKAMFLQENPGIVFEQKTLGEI